MALKQGDLEHLVSYKLHIDSYASKMGRDADVITLSFKVRYRNAAEDLMHFLEKGYDWILDADVSAGSMQDGNWLVFVEMLRRPGAAKRILEMLQDLQSITGNSWEKYVFAYRDLYGKDYRPASLETLKTIPLSPREYKRRNRDSELQTLLNNSGLNGADIERNYSKDVVEFANLSRYR